MRLFAGRRVESGRDDWDRARTAARRRRYLGFDEHVLGMSMGGIGECRLTSLTIDLINSLNRHL